MGKRLARAALLEEIRVEREKLDALLGQIPPRKMTRAGVTPGGWSVKDILAHLIDWQARNLYWYEAGLRGEAPAVPEPGLTWRDIKRLNAIIYEKHRRRTLAAILRDYDAFHRRMIDMIDSIPDGDLVTVGRYAWTGPTWTLSDFARANTASHYRWARKWIGRWVRAHSHAARPRVVSRSDTRSHR
jgi:hypothetical protein